MSRSPSSVLPVSRTMKTTSGLTFRANTDSTVRGCTEASFLRWTQIPRRKATFPVSQVSPQESRQLVPGAPYLTPKN
jgi:hypothetical protein